MNNSGASTSGSICSEKISALSDEVASLQASLQTAEANLVVTAHDDAAYENANRKVSQISEALRDRRRRLEALRGAHLEQCRAERRQRYADAAEEVGDLQDQVCTLQRKRNEIFMDANLEAARAVAAADADLAEARANLQRAQDRAELLKDDATAGSISDQAKAEAGAIQSDKALRDRAAKIARTASARRELAMLGGEIKFVNNDSTALQLWQSGDRCQSWKDRKSAVEKEIERINAAS